MVFDGIVLDNSLSRSNKGATMRIVQIVNESGASHVAVVSPDGETLQIVANTSSSYQLAMDAISEKTNIASLISTRGFSSTVHYDEVVQEKRLKAPLAHPDPLHCFVTGTGLTHLGSANARNKMHQLTDAEQLTDSMKMFAMGVENGKPAHGSIGVQPEWFYKGNGSSLVGPEEDLTLPAYADDGGEEPEIVGVYLIAADRIPYRIGYALGNEYSDHVMERQNYLWLAPSKIRTCSFGPELLLGELPSHIEGVSRIIRGTEIFWEKPFISGEENMSHSISNLEYHHFKYPIFREPGTVHVHYFGTGTASFADGVVAKDGDVFEIESALFGRPLRNPLRSIAAEQFSVLSL